MELTWTPEQVAYVEAAGGDCWDELRYYSPDDCCRIACSHFLNCVPWGLISLPRLLARPDLTDAQLTGVLRGLAQNGDPPALALADEILEAEAPSGLSLAGAEMTPSFGHRASYEWQLARGMRPPEDSGGIYWCSGELLAVWLWRDAGVPVNYGAIEAFMTVNMGRLVQKKLPALRRLCEAGCPAALDWADDHREVINMIARERRQQRQAEAAWRRAEAARRRAEVARQTVTAGG